MSVVAPRSDIRRRRRHRRGAPVVEHVDRRALEQAGWRTLLEYRENHVRAADGTLVAVLPRWSAEAELELGADVAVPGGGGASSRGQRRVLVATATGDEPAAAWAALRRRAADLVSVAFV